MASSFYGMVAYETNGRLRNGHIRQGGVQFLERRGQMGYTGPLTELVGRQFVVHVRALQARDHLVAIGLGDVRPVMTGLRHPVDAMGVRSWVEDVIGRDAERDRAARDSAHLGRVYEAPPRLGVDDDPVEATVLEQQAAMDRAD